MLLDVSSSDFAKHVTKIRQDAGEKNLAGAKAVFEAKERFVSRIPSRALVRRLAAPS